MPSSQAIDGLASGLNTTEIINAIMEFERRPAALMEARQAAITNEITTFNALSAKLLALQTSLGGLSNRRAFSQASISVSDDTLVNATADGVPPTGTYTLNILSLASNHQIASHGYDDASQSVLGTGTITIALGDAGPTAITVDSDNNSLVGIKQAINDADIGVTATIINDGSGSKPYRLVLTGDKTGQQNTISVTGSLSGGLDLDFETSVFDAPEIIDFASGSTSLVSLGASASFTGSTNKIYTFTVAGNGQQTVGTGNITLDWTDGDSSGSIVVSQADTEVVGPDGLKLSFGDGILTGGDTFQVSTFAPILQQAADARVSFGSSANGASPLVVRSDTNSIDDLISGVTIELKGVTTPATGPVTITTGVDTEGIRGKIESFIQAYNEVKDFIDSQNEFNQDTGEGGVLLGDMTLMTVQSRLSRLITERIPGLDDSLNTLSAIGIRTGLNGALTIRDSSALSAALENDFESVLSLFVDNGRSSSEQISFVSSSADIVGGSEFAVNITQAATHGYYQGEKINDPSSQNIILTDSANRIKLRIDGVVSNEISLTPGTYTSGQDLADELQARIDSDDKIGNLGVTVDWVDLGGDGYLKLTSASYGSSSKVEVITSVPNSAYSRIGLSGGMTHYGDDVAGTINGEAATGRGQMLTGDEGNSTTDGLRLLVTASSSDLGEGDEGTITVTKGVATILTEALDNLTQSGNGVIARKTTGLQNQVDNIRRQISDFDERLALRRESLVRKWMEFESILSQLQSEEAFLSSQLENVQANFAKILGKE